MRLDLSVYSVLLVLGLGLAYWASLPSSNDDLKKINVMSIEPNSIQEISFNSPEVTSVATRSADQKQFWIKLSKTKTLPTPTPTTTPSPTPSQTPVKPGDKPGETPVASPTPAPTPTPPPPTETKTENFLASDKIDDLFSSFNPFQAMRVIGKVTDEKTLDEFGLKDPKESLIITTKDKGAYELKLGKRSYGSANRFVLDVKKNEVLLVDDTPFDQLKKADYRLFERRLIALNFDDLTKALIKFGEKSKKLAHTKRDDKGNIQWTTDDDAATPKPQYSTWLGNVQKLRVVSFSDETQTKQLTEAPPVLEIALEKDGTVLDTLVFKKLPTSPDSKEDKNEKGDTAPFSYWVTSQFLKTFAKINASRMDTIEKDIPNIID